ncbi:hypothetical protein LTR17_015531 [Elasticomyces elasticus]|nr:hypothetical protein LTR17_015531 [Elasticomyces elasticus]
MNGHLGWCNCPHCPQGLQNAQVWGNDYAAMPKYRRNPWCALWDKYAPGLERNGYPYFGDPRIFEFIHLAFAGYPLAPYKVAQYILWVCKEVYKGYRMGHLGHGSLHLMADLEELAEQVEGGMLIGYRNGNRSPLRNERWASESKAAARDIWKLDRRDVVTATEAEATLTSRGFAFQPETSVQRLRVLLRRSDRRLRSYECLTDAELRQLCQEHEVSVELNATANDMKSALQHADDKMTFPRFLKLAAELRVLVYSHYVKDLEQGTLAMQPPLTMATKQLRKEALPVFYDTHRFGVHSKVLDNGAFEYLVPSDLTRAMMQGISDANLAQMRKLRVYVAAVVPAAECDVDLGGKDLPARLEDVRVPDTWTPRRVQVEWKAIFAARVEKVLADFNARPAGEGSRQDDISALVRAVYRDHYEDYPGDT